MSAFSIELSINEKLYLRDPQRSEVGRRILKHSVLLLDEIGLERFTFKKLAGQIGSTEATIYRYFVSKQMLLLYLTNWYWEWMKVHIDYAIHNIESPVERLRRAIQAVVDTAKRNTHVEFIDEDILHRIVVVEGTKSYRSKEVDEQNKEGFFLSYKTLSSKLAELILDVSPQFPYPRALATNILEMANNHIYFAEHLPRLTDVHTGDDMLDQVVRMLETFVMRLLGIIPANTLEIHGGDRIQNKPVDAHYPAEPGSAPDSEKPQPNSGRQIRSESGDGGNIYNNHY